MKKHILALFLLLITSCEPNEHGKHALNIRNNTSERIFYWYSRDFYLYHYPQISLPVDFPMGIQSVSANNISLASGIDPDWHTIFSELPEGLFTIYFFETRPETQEDWDVLRENMEELVYRKDTSYEELKANNYIIEYP